MLKTKYSKMFKKIKKSETNDKNNYVVSVQLSQSEYERFKAFSILLNDVLTKLQERK